MPGRREAGEAVLSLLAGVLLALLGWVALRQLTASTLGSLAGTEGPGREWTVTLLFRAKECPSQMAVIETLNRLDEPLIRIQGVLVVNRAEFKDWQALVRANQIEFPVRIAAPDAASQALGSTPTPALAIFDPKGRLRMLTNLTDPSLTDEILAQVVTLATRSPEGS